MEGIRTFVAKWDMSRICAFLYCFDSDLTQVSDRGHNNFHDEMKVSVFMDDIWDFIAMINNSLHFRFSIIAMKKEIIFSVLPFMSMIILFKHDPQSLIAMNRII